MSYQNIPTPPTPDEKRQNRRQKKSGNGKIIGLCAAIAIAGVAASGFVGYAGAKLATKDSASSNSSIISHAPSISSDGKIQVMDVSDVVAHLRPSVVEITTEMVSSGNSIFGQYIASGAGSGVILSEDGYIVTNNHVIENANSISVKTSDGQVFDAKLIGTDPQTDIAVIKVDAHDLTPATVGNSDDIKVGEAAIAIGNPLGSLGGTVTTGIISAVGREITIENETMTLLQTDAAINSGNSGGGLFDINGQLIGIVNAKQAAAGIEGLGFAIPISDVTQIIDDLVEHGTVTSRPILNVTLQDVQMSPYTNMKPGVYVYQVTQNGAADKAGVKSGDMIVSIDGKEVKGVSEIKSVLRKHEIGDEITLTVERDGKTLDLTVTLQGSGKNV